MKPYGNGVSPHPQCTAKSKQSGERCRRASTPGRTVCYYHGGATPVGIANKRLKSGIYSDHMPPMFAEAHESAKAHLDEISNLNDDLVWLHTSICRHLESLQTGERGTVWDELQDLLMDAQTDDDMDKAAILQRLTELTDRGKTTVQAERDILDLIERKSKLRLAQSKIESDAGLTMSTSKVKETLAKIIMVFRAACFACADTSTAQRILTMTQADLETVLYGSRPKPTPVIDVTPDATVETPQDEPGE